MYCSFTHEIENEVPLDNEAFIEKRQGLLGGLLGGSYILHL